jgi:hypothetical protein
MSMTPVCLWHQQLAANFATSTADIVDNSGKLSLLQRHQEQIMGTKSDG